MWREHFSGAAGLEPDNRGRNESEGREWTCELSSREKCAAAQGGPEVTPGERTDGSQVQERLGLFSADGKGPVFLLRQ